MFMSVSSHELQGTSGVKGFVLWICWNSLDSRECLLWKIMDFWHVTAFPSCLPVRLCPQIVDDASWSKYWISWAGCPYSVASAPSNTQAIVCEAQKRGFQRQRKLTAFACDSHLRVWGSPCPRFWQVGLPMICHWRWPCRQISRTPKPRALSDLTQLKMNCTWLYTAKLITLDSKDNWTKH